MTLGIVKSRFIFTFGGETTRYILPDSSIEKVRRLDTNKICKGWYILELKNPREKNGFFYGVIPLDVEDESEDNFEFLIFGSGNDVNPVRVFSAHPCRISAPANFLS